MLPFFVRKDFYSVSWSEKPEKWVIGKMKRRNSLDVEAEILEVARQGARKTWIVYKANLNFEIVKGYLKELVEMGLLYHEGMIYRTTKHGLMFLEQYANLKKVIVPVIQLGDDL